VKSQNEVGERGEGRSRASARVDEEMEEVEEREEDSISNVRMDVGQGTFIAGTGGATVGEVRAAS
jgi:hypothetical protein